MTVVLIVDDHHLIRAGVKNLLERERPELRVEGASTLAQALERLSGPEPIGLVLLDIALPDSHALEGLVRLKERCPATPVALLSGTEDNDLIRSALGLGADGFIPKSADPRILLHAVGLVLDGEIFLPRAYLTSPAAQAADPGPAPSSPARSSFTARQRDVLDLMREGLSNKEIARRLDLSESTIKTHVSSVLKRLGASSRAKVIASLPNSRP